MQEEVNLQENNLHKKRKNKHIDVKFNFLMAQIIVCVLALIVVFALKTIGGELYTYSKAVFSENFDKPINIRQVLDANQARKIVAAQATVYGMGGESDQKDIPYVEKIDEISEDEKDKLSAAELNTMCLPLKGRVTCEFGYRTHPITGKYSMHKGIDIGADMNSDIITVMEGTVKKTVENDEDYGNYVIVTHSDGVDTMYAHCSKLLVKGGQQLKKGDKIALVGSSGLSTGPHLHFEIRVNNIRLNPRWFIDF